MRVTAPRVCLPQSIGYRVKTYSSIFSFLAAFLFLFGFASAKADSGSVTLKKSEIEEIVRQYILDHPEILAESLRNWQKAQRLAEEKKKEQQLTALAADIYENPMTPVSGSGDVTIVEFFDYQCGYCKRVFSALAQLMEDDRKIRIVWKEMPILGPASRYASRAAMAAKKQDKYLPFHRALMQLRGRLSQSSVMEVAKSVGLDTARLVKDMENPAIDEYLDRTLQLANAIGIDGTPAFIIGGKLYPGAVGLEDMQRLIKEARASKS